MALYSAKGQVILASASLRRKELLESTGLKFSIEVSKHLEARYEGEAVAVFSARVAKEKAELVAARIPDAWVIGADTSVILDSELFGKPKNKQDAFRMLEALQGKTHQVVSSFAIVKHAAALCHFEVHSTDVEMRELSTKEIEAYIASGETMDKAGAYAIQGAGGAFINRINGSFSNVIGLNIAALIAALLKLEAIV